MKFLAEPIVVSLMAGDLEEEPLRAPPAKSPSLIECPPPMEYF